MNYEIDLVSGAAQKNFLSGNNSSANTVTTSSDYAKILQEKISEVEQNFEDAKKSLQNSVTATETVKRFMPDGTIVITTYEGSSILQRTEFKPHLVPVADYSAPPTPSGQPATKFVPKQNLDLLSLLM